MVSTFLFSAPTCSPRLSARAHEGKVKGEQKAEEGSGVHRHRRPANQGKRSKQWKPGAEGTWIRVSIGFRQRAQNAVRTWLDPFPSLALPVPCETARASRCT